MIKSHLRHFPLQTSRATERRTSLVNPESRLHLLCSHFLKFRFPHLVSNTSMYFIHNSAIEHEKLYKPFVNNRGEELLDVPSGGKQSPTHFKGTDYESWVMEVNRTDGLA